MLARARTRAVGRLSLATMLSAALLVSGGSATAGAEAAAVRLARQWAGQLEGSDAYISVFTLTNGDAGAYLADGQELATLLLGQREGRQLDLRPREGTAVSATVEGSEVTGTVTIDGVEHDYAATRTTGEGGWYRGLKTVKDERLAAGFIVLGDGSARGAIRLDDDVIATPAFDPDDLTLDVPGGGTIEVLPVAKFVKKHQTLDPGGTTAAATLTAQVPSPYVVPATQADGTFVTEDATAPTWLALVIQGDHAIGYACDGAGVWGTLSGTVDGDGSLELTGRGSARLSFTGSVEGSSVTGTLTVGGDQTAYTLSTAQPGATGLYREAVGDGTTWWIQTPAGLKGATLSTSGRRGRTFATSDASGFNSNTAAGAGEAP